MKKKVYIGIAIALAVVIGLSSYLFFRVEAQGILTGLEEKVTEKVAEGENFQLVEIVPDGAMGELGCLVKHDEQDMINWLYEDYIAGYLKQDEARQNNRENRLAYVEWVQNTYAYAIGMDNKPIHIVQNYEEAYFPSDTENWKTLEFAKEHYEQAAVAGVYEPAADGKGAYEMNIEEFTYSLGTGCYEVVFGTTMLTDKEEDIYKQAYHVREVDANNNQIMEPAGADETEGLYYIQSYEYKGVGVEGAGYAAIPNMEKPYYYVGENGTYQFYEDAAFPQTQVEIGKIYYKISIENRDWFRTKILASKDSGALSIETATYTESQLADADLSKADFIYVCGDIENAGKSYKNTAKVWEKLSGYVNGNRIPCMIEASTKVWEHAGPLLDGYTGQKDFVKQNLYIYSDGDDTIRQSFIENIDVKIEDINALNEVLSFVKRENTMRSGEELLSTDITRAFLMQYIIDYGRQREAVTKDSFRVLQLQPTDAATPDTTGFELTHAQIAKWAGVEELSGDAITIDTMSMAEFIGKVDDLNKKYDLIYIGASIDELNTAGTGAKRHTVYNDARMDGLIYTHTGDYVLGEVNISGMLDTDYAAAYVFGQKSRENDYLMYDNGFGYVFFENRTSYTTEGILRQKLEKVSPLTKYVGAGLNAKVTDADLCGDLGVYRYSGNDITKTKLTELLEYAKANYPVVVSDALYQTDAAGNKNVNVQTVDNTSYLYQFLEQTKGEKNVFSVSQLQADASDIGIYLNLAKPKLLYFDEANPQVLEEYEGILTEAGAEFSDVSKMKIDKTNAQATGTYLAKIGFYLASTVDASASVVYTPKFYMDLNADGKFLEAGTNGASELMACVIYNADTGAEAPKDAQGNYQLSSHIRYRLERSIPATYLGILSWKLEVEQTTNPNIRTEDIQYTKVDGIGEEEDVHVLQITSMSSVENNNRVNLAADKVVQKYLKDIQSKTGLAFQIDTIGGSAFEDMNADSGEEFYHMRLKGLTKSLADYDMLIIGFADMYHDIDNDNYAIEAINYFIKSGKSVLFSHDTTSYINIRPSHSFESIHISILGFNNINQNDWGYDMSSAFRDTLGMDRYGIVSDTDITDDEELRQQSEFLKQGQHLTVNTQTGEAVVNACINTTNGNNLTYFATREMRQGSLSNRRDIAYAANTYNSKTGTAQAYGQTQGFTNGLLNWHLCTTGYMQNGGSPYLNLKNSLLSSNSSSQVKAKATQVNDGLIAHYPYEIGEEFNTAKTHFQYYQLHMDQDIDGDNKGDIVVWYCLSDDAESATSNAGKAYRTSPNDVRNNYYIYNIGNVTYTGMGHSALSHTGSDIETKLFINTIVAAYKAGVESPDIKILETAEKTSVEKRYEYITYDDAVTGTALSNGVEFYFTISDPNLTSSKKKMTVDFSYYNGTEEVPLGADEIEVMDVTTNTAVNGDYTEGHVYKARIKNAAAKLAQTGTGSVDFKAKVTSSFNYYGKKETHSTGTYLTVIKMSLFDLN